jgi:uncharacterized DUF497 family protein
MIFEWDEKKRASNLRKHGIDFADLPAVFSGFVATIQDDRFEYTEPRYLTIGLLGVGVVVVSVSHTETESLIRIISAREATKNEKETFFNEIKKYEKN